MDAWSPQEPEFNESEEETPQQDVAFVATQEAISVRVAEIPDRRTPDGMICMGTFLDDRTQPIARSAVEDSMLSDLENSGAFGDPVRLALAAVEENPGLQCRLYALLPAEHFREEEPEPEAPWAASVPRFEESDHEEVAENSVVPLLLGQIVRFQRDRKHPDDLALEAGDVLQTILSKESATTEVVDKLLEDLLGDG